MQRISSIVKNRDRIISETQLIGENYVNGRKQYVLVTAYTECEQQEKRNSLTTQENTMNRSDTVIAHVTCRTGFPGFPDFPSFTLRTLINTFQAVNT